MEMPPENLPVRTYESQPVTWFLKGYTAAGFRELLSKAQCPGTQIQELLDPKRLDATPAGLTVHPSDSAILGLSPESRGGLYEFLRQFPENEAQRDLFHWPAADEPGLFKDSDVSVESRQQFTRLCYRRGDVLLFSDLPVLLRRLPDERQRTALVKVLTRRPVIFASLKVSPQTDLTSLISYWGRGGDADQILPVLEGAASLPRGRQISIAALLPSSARELLYTFPLPGGGPRPNCHWTTFNFFKENPDPPTADEQFWLQKLNTEYAPVQDAPRYGDILVLRKPDGDILHTCIYLADDIVYTKNGVSHWAPWQLTTLKDLLEYYSWDVPGKERLKVAYYRSRSPGGSHTT